jgi:lipopolysaccharide transport system permease protein
MKFLIAPFISLSKNRELLSQFARRDLEAETKGSILGFSWIVTQPLMMLGLYTFVFGFIFRGKYGAFPDETTLDYGLGIYLSITIYGMFASALSGSSRIILSQANFVKKVVFPLEILPAASFIASVVRFLINLILVCIGIGLFGRGFSLQIFWFPLIIVPLLFLCIGTYWLISALGVFVRDIGQTMIFLSTAMLWASAVFFPIQKIPESIYWFLRFNPLIHAIDFSRACLLWGINPINSNLWGFCYLWLFGVVMLYLGHFVFMKLRPWFADVI